ncbi:group I truncated hemoglobin [Pseudidiomarina aquimaris]|uniref:group I truncated hemoglobin n=1 Tax=Pseudidiomarina aquimaris TaxID=641841 RepID=UPI003A987105|tara:strand:+ start:532 stop:951 length:420 start_codon:yes stop_codon:yes gene_type:complete
MKFLQMTLMSFVLLLAAAGANASSLYQELGEKEGIDDLMAAFVLEIAKDERVIEHFENADIDRFHRMISLHVCELVGGPCTYDGANMIEVHTGMGITRTEFNAIVENLISAMEQQEIPVSAQNQLLDILADFHGEIVGR